MVSLNLLYLGYRKIPDNVVSELYLFGFEPSMIIISLEFKILWFCNFRQVIFVIIKSKMKTKKY
jgi:hypothetical protein